MTKTMTAAALAAVMATAAFPGDVDELIPYAAKADWETDLIVFTDTTLGCVATNQNERASLMVYAWGDGSYNVKLWEGAPASAAGTADKTFDVSLVIDFDVEIWRGPGEYDGNGLYLDLPGFGPVADIAAGNTLSVKVEGGSGEEIYYHHSLAGSYFTISALLDCQLKITE